MIDSTAKQNVPDPAANPSTPSVMFTALEAPTMTRTAKITQSTEPMSIPMASDRVKDSAVDVWAQSTDRIAKASAHTNWA